MATVFSKTEKAVLSSLSAGWKIIVLCLIVAFILILKKNICGEDSIDCICVIFTDC